MKIPVVNENDEIIEMKERDEVADTDILRVSALWITNSKDEILLAKRAPTKKHDPDKWGPAVAGTVEEHESYDENIIKETQEEIGVLVDLKNLTLGPKLRLTGRHELFCQWYITKLDLPLEAFKLEPLEVTEIRWVPRKELETLFGNEPDLFIKTAPKSFPELLKLTQ